MNSQATLASPAEYTHEALKRRLYDGYHAAFSYNDMEKYSVPGAEKKRQNNC
jgi:hypothetical protein